MKVYLDSCIVIYLVQGPTSFHERVISAMSPLGAATFCVSDLVRLECRVGPLIHSQPDILALFDQLFSALSVLTLSSPVFDMAAELRAAHRLKTPDAIHVAAAIVHGCSELWTNDQRLTCVEPRIAVRALS